MSKLTSIIPASSYNITHTNTDLTLTSETAFYNPPGMKSHLPL